METDLCPANEFLLWLCRRCRRRRFLSSSPLLYVRHPPLPLSLPALGERDELLERERLAKAVDDRARPEVEPDLRVRRPVDPGQSGWGDRPRWPSLAVGRPEAGEPFIVNDDDRGPLDLDVGLRGREGGRRRHLERAKGRRRLARLPHVAFEVKDGVLRGERRKGGRGGGPSEVGRGR